MERQPGLYKLVGKAMLDADFRVRLLKEPEETAESVGVVLTEAQVNGIREADPEKVEMLAEHFRELIVPTPMSW